MEPPLSEIDDDEAISSCAGFSGISPLGSIEEFEEYLLETDPDLVNRIRNLELEQCSAQSSTQYKLPSRREREKKLLAMMERKASIDRERTGETTETKILHPKEASKLASKENLKKAMEASVLGRFRHSKYTGPLARLTEFVKAHNRLRIVLRGRSEVCRVLTATVVAFDKHWNMLVRDVDEVLKAPAKSKSFGYGANVPKCLQYVTKSYGVDRLLTAKTSEKRTFYQRYLMCSFVMGFNVVLVQKLQ
ncbi:hypothetical protein AB6A40_011070 [Gnathostoma spinigerum]|uniref:LSM domain-containing protein n=1 Tax=Gnathostoma spinigerum TaxID=75299 RepID=A0ABD6EYD3_9BILA